MISRRLCWPRYAPLPRLIRDSPTHRNRSRSTDFLHRKHRAHIRATRGPYEALVALIITRNISELELQQIVHISTGTVKLNDFRHRTHGGGKVLKPFFRMLASSHQDERGNAYPELRWVEKSNPLENDPFLFKVLAREVAALVQGLRSMDLYKVPGVAETLDWARSLAALGATRIDSTLVNATIGAALKYQEDLERVREQVPAMVEKARGA